MPNRKPPSNGVSPTQRRGFLAEQRALDYLLARGLVLLERNFRARCGEIDLVMRDGPGLVFVEVRYRASLTWGGAAASVTPAKQQRVRRAAQTWVAARLGSRGLPACRFDVVALEGEDLEWIRGAF